MTQLGEPVAVGMVEETKYECPFDHELEKVVVANDYVGNGGTLGKKRMEKGLSTFIYSNAAKAKGKNCDKLKAKYQPQFEGLQDPESIKAHLDPRNRSGSEKITNITIEWQVKTNKRDWEGEPIWESVGKTTYPLTSAAHHLIPAQDSLKGNPI